MGNTLDTEPEHTEPGPVGVTVDVSSVPGTATDEPPLASTAQGTATSTARNAVVLATATIMSRLGAFGLAVAMGRALGAGDYGRYGFASALAIVLVPLADVGISPYLLREVAQARDVAEGALPRLLRVKVTLAVLFTVVVAGIAAVLAADATMVAIVVLVLVTTLVDGFSMFVFGYFRGRERMGFEAGLTGLTTLVRSLVGIALVLVTRELVPVLVWMLCVSGAQLTVAIMRLRGTVERRPPRSGRSAVIRWRAVAAIGGIALFTMIYSRVDSVLVGALQGDRLVGFYTAAYTVMLGLQMAPWMISTALTPVFARTWQHERALFESSWHEGMRAVMAVALPFSLLTTLLGSRIMRDVFGPEFRAAGVAVAILVWASPLAAFNTIVTAVLRAAHRDHWLIKSSFLAVILNVGLNLWAIPTFGIAGAASVTVGTEVLVTLVIGGLAVRHGIVPAPRVPYVGLLLSLGALAAVAVLARALPLGVLAVAAMAVYAASLLVTRVVGRSDLQLARRVVAARTAS